MILPEILYFRVEANTTTAMGHMTRCVSIADGAKKIGIDSVFIVAETCSARLPESKGYKVICLNRRWDDFDGEIPIIEGLIKENNIKTLLVDSYWVSEKYMEAVNKMTRLAYIDDLYEKIWPVSAVINYSVYQELFDYARDYEGKKLILGTKYFPLRSEYVGLPKRQISGEVKEILVVSGGSDELSFMKTMAEKLIETCSFEGIHFTFILGPFNKDYNEIMKITSDVTSITVLKSLPTLKEAMLKADVLISAGGTTLYEMAACSLPGIVYILADNQKYNAEGFGRKGLAMYAGDIREKETINNIFKYLSKLVDDRQLRQDMIDRLYELLDGQGATRIAEELCYYQ